MWTFTTLIIETIANVELQVLLAPAKSIASNAGVDGEIVVEKTRTCNWQTGYNAMTGRYEDLVSAGVADPCQVLRCALQNAVSTAGVVLITQAVLVEKIKNLSQRCLMFQAKLLKEKISWKAS